MNPIVMSVVLVGLIGAFVFSASRRWKLMQIGLPENRWDDIAERLRGTWRYAFRQTKMSYYPLAGLAHKLIFVGFMVLLLRSVILWGRGFDPSFSLFVLGHEPFLGLPLGHVYEFTKDIVASLVIFGAVVFLYYRLVKREARMTISGEGVLILGIIIVMMLSDMMYDGAQQVLHFRHLGAPPDTAGLAAQVSRIIAPLGAATPVPPALTWVPFPSPAGSLFAVVLGGASTSLLVGLAHAGFWTHSSLVLIFLNLLPYSKHFHIITAIPNVFTRDLTPPGRLPLVGKSADEIGEMVMKTADEPETAAPVGLSQIEHFSWKAILDFYTCTECGRCSDNCPAHRTGKLLSPKQFTLNLRDHLYGREKELVGAAALGRGQTLGPAEGVETIAPGGASEGSAPADESAAQAAVEKPPQVELVPGVIHPDVLWACTTCRACEEQCPVMISYVDKIIGMRRNLVLVKGEFPAELNGPFQAMEVNGNPWNLSRLDRSAWTDGLDVKTMSDNPKAEVLYWVGCAASYDDRAKKVARATAKLLNAAGVDWAILGQEETCTGDPARRAGNEYLFAMLAEQNVGALNGYKDQGGARTIVTTCPHCFNTLKNEYPDFGAKFDVVHHTEFLLGLVARKKLVPVKPVAGRVVFHDSCYLGRYNDVYEPPREILRRIPGVELVEAEGWNKQRGLCCGAGGAQMWMEEQNKERVNVRRTLQLLETAPKTIATGCPFCQTMITDGLKDQSKEETVRQLDVIELLAESCDLDAAPAPAA